MAVANTNVFFSPKSLSSFPKFNPTPTFPATLVCQKNHAQKRKGSNSTVEVASASSLSVFPPLNVDYLEREFSNNGVGFEEIGDSCVVRLSLDEGSRANLMLPEGLITSYKPHMWHGGCEEVLHTVVSRTEEEGEVESVVVRGGVSVGVKVGSTNGDGDSWSPTGWFLRDVKGSSDSSLQIELGCGDTLESIDFRQIITLEKDLLSSEIVISNSGISEIQMQSSFLTHLTVSTPDAVYAIGLERSNYFNKPPLRSDFSIIPPHFVGTRKISSSSKQNWGEKAMKGLFSGWNRKGGDHKPNTENSAEAEEEKEEVELEETDNYLPLTEKMSRIYTYAPRSFTLIDRGRRNSVVIGRSGFEEFHVFSPGSQHEWYGKYAFVCAGPSATLNPVILGPQDVWRGIQVLYNPSS